MDCQTLIDQSRLNAAIEAEELTIFATLAPKIYPDNNTWCVLLGDDIATGVCGFGDTPRKAIMDFNKSFDKSISKQ